MKKLFILTAVGVLFAFIISRRDRRLSADGAERQEKLFTVLLMIVLATYGGLRTWYNDTVTYIGIFEQMPSFRELWKSGSATFAGGLGFTYLTALLKDIGFSSQDYIMFYSYITVVPYVWFVRKHSDSFPMAIYLMFTTGFYIFSFAAIKQCAATAMCLIATSAAIEKKWKKYIVFLVLGTLFHPYSVVFLIIPLLFFRPWSIRTFIYTAIFIILGFSLQSLIGTILDITILIGANYDAASFIGEGVNIFRVLVCLVPFGLSFFYKNTLFNDSDRSENLIFNMAMVNGLIMFVGLFGTANYFARLANYFLPAQCITLPWMLKKIGGKDRQILTVLCVIGYMGFFIYGNRIQHIFDKSFSQISLWTYIQSHFGA